MKEDRRALRIGAFVLAGTGILLGALFLFGIRSALEKTYHFETYQIADVEGLSKGSPVKLRGVTVGKVTNIAFSWNLYPGANPRCVVIRFAIQESVSPVPASALEVRTELRRLVDNGLRAIVKAQGITGSSVLSLEYLDPKTYPPMKYSWESENIYIPSAPSQFGQMLASLERTLDHLEHLDFNRVLTRLDDVLASADAALQKMGELDVGEISRSVGRVADDAGNTVREIQALASDARETLRSMQLGAVGKDADKLIVDLDARLDALIEKLSAIDVRALNDTLAGTREAARNLNDALEELKKHPSGFLFGGAPPPPRGWRRSPSL